MSEVRRNDLYGRTAAQAAGPLGFVPSQLVRGSHSPPNKFRVSHRAADGGPVIFRHAFLNGIAALNNMLSVDNAPAMKKTLPESYLRRMTPTQASLVLRQLNTVDEKSQNRVAAARLYQDGLAGVEGVSLPPLREDLSHTYSYYAIQVQNRESVLKELMRNYRDVAAQHLKNCADQDCFTEFFRDCPRARLVSRRVILLPTYPRYGQRDIERNIGVIRRIFGV